MPRAKTEEERRDIRDLICQVSERLFVERGLDGFSLRELAAELGISQMAPYRYFKDKAEILAAVRASAFARFAGVLEAAFREGDTPMARARSIGTAYLGFVLAESDAYRLIFDLTQPNEDQYPELAAQSARAKAILARQAQDLIATGLAPAGQEQVTNALWSAAHGVCVLFLAGKFRDVESFQAAYRATMRWLFIGLKADAERASSTPTKKAKETS